MFDGKYKLAIVDANYLIYHAAWKSREFPLASTTELRLLLRGLLERLQTGIPEVILFADSKEDPPEDFQTRAQLYSKIRTYKGNRHDDPRILEVKELVREALMEWTVHYPGYEADDLVYTAWTQNHLLVPDKLLIVSADKDMDQIPGWHYDPVKDKEYFVTPDQATYNFWLQMMVGDSVDNIRGIPKVGGVTAGRILVPLETHRYSQAVRNKYIEVLGKEQGQEEFDITHRTLLLWFCPLMQPFQGIRSIEDLLKEL